VEFNLISKSTCDASELNRIRNEYARGKWENVVTAATITSFLSSFTATQTSQDSATNLASCLKRFNVITFVKDNAMHGICGKTFQHERAAQALRDEAAAAGQEAEKPKDEIEFPLHHGFFTSAALDAAEKRGTPVIRTTELQNELVQDLVANVDIAVGKDGAMIAKQRAMTVNSATVRAKLPVGLGSQVTKLINDRVKDKQLVLPSPGTKGQDLASHLTPVVARYPDADVRFEMGQISSCDPQSWAHPSIGSTYKDHVDATHKIRTRRPGLGVMSTIRDITSVELQYENLSVWSHLLGGPKADLEFLAEQAYDGAAFSQAQRRQITLLRDMSMLKFDEDKIYFFNTGDEDIVHFLWFNLANDHTGAKKRLRFSCRGNTPTTRTDYEKLLETGGVIIAAGVPTDNFASLYKKGRINTVAVEQTFIPTVVIIDFDNCKGMAAAKAVEALTKARSYVDSLIGTWGTSPFVTRQHVFGAMPDDIISPCFSGHHGFVWIASNEADIKKKVAYPDAIGHCLVQAQFCFFYRYCRIPWFMAVDHLRANFTIGIAKAKFLLDLHPCDIYWYARPSKKDKSNIDFSDMSMAGMEGESVVAEVDLESSIVGSTQPINPSRTTHTVEKDRAIRGRSRAPEKIPEENFGVHDYPMPRDWKKIVGAGLDYWIKYDSGKDFSKNMNYLADALSMVGLDINLFLKAVANAEREDDIAGVKTEGPTYLMNKFGDVEDSVYDEDNNDDGSGSEDWGGSDDDDDNVWVDLEREKEIEAEKTVPESKVAAKPSRAASVPPPTNSRARASPAAVLVQEETPL